MEEQLNNQTNESAGEQAQINEKDKQILQQQQEAEDFAKLRTGVSYEKSTDKYKDNFSTAVTFIFFGIAGIIVLILNYLSILPLFKATGSSGVLINIVLGIMFLLFIGIGIYSFKLAKKAKVKIAAEEEELSKITEWMQNNITAEAVENSYDGSSIAEEMKYFNRCEYLKNIMSNEFQEVPEDILDSLIDDFIEETFNK